MRKLWLEASAFELRAENTPFAAAKKHNAAAAAAANTAARENGRIFGVNSAQKSIFNLSIRYSYNTKGAASQDF